MQLEGQSLLNAGNAKKKIKTAMKERYINTYISLGNFKDSDVIGAY